MRTQGGSRRAPEAAGCLGPPTEWEHLRAVEGIRAAPLSVGNGAHQWVLSRVS